MSTLGHHTCALSAACAREGGRAHHERLRARPQTHLRDRGHGLAPDALCFKFLLQTCAQCRPPKYEEALSMLRRIQSEGMGDLADIMPRWKPWIPPKQDQEPHHN